MVNDLLAMLVKMNDLRKQNDIDGASQIAKEILLIKPRNRSAIERILAFFIDYEYITEAEESLSYLIENFKHNPYQYVLGARIAELKGEYKEALINAEKGLSYQLPDWQKALLYNILGRIYTSMGDVKKAAENYLLSSGLEESPSKLEDYSNYLFSLHYREIPREEMFSSICYYSNMFRNIQPYSHNREYTHKKIRIGYISPDFRYHIVAFFCYAMLKQYDKNRFEVYAYANCLEDNASRDFSNSVDVWRNVKGCTYSEIAEIIYNDELDILVDLSGHTANNCLPVMAYKPAPVQISGIGWFDTTGLPTIDYFVGDNYVDPVGLNDEYFTEKILRMSHSHLCYMWHDNPPNIEGAPFIHNGFITFGCFNNFAKVSDDMLCIWAEILRQLPKARLLLKSKVFDISICRKKIAERLLLAEISLDRVEMQGYSSDYLQVYNNVDVALDTYPYPGGGTTCDALYMGVPVVTMVGKSHNSRFGYSLLKNIDLDELCAFTKNEYITIACNLARNKNKLLELRRTLRRKMLKSRIMDSAAYMHELELYYEKINRNKDITNISISILKIMEEQGDWVGIIRSASRLLVTDCTKSIKAQALSLMGKAYLVTDKYGNAARAKYCLQLASKYKSIPDYLLILCYLSEAAEAADDFKLRYEAAHEAANTVLSKDIQSLPTWWMWNIHTFCAHAAIDMGYYDEAESEYELASKLADNQEHKLQALSSYILVSHYKTYTTEEIWERQQKYAKVLSETIRKLPINEKKRNKSAKIRVGYLSPDLRNHAMFPILYAMFACANHDDFVVIGYQLNETIDEYTKHLKKLADEWYDLSNMPYIEAAKRIKEDDIDILVDLASHSRGTGLPIMAYRPARVHVSGLGSLCSTGTKVVDYYITDSIVDPPAMHDKYFAEKLLYLPAQFSYAGREDVPEVAGTPCVNREYIQLGCFQAYRKITDTMLLTWKTIMERLPKSRLLLKSISFTSISLVDCAYERFSQLGLPMERIEFEAGDSNYMERCLDVDIMLDTYPYTGGRTTFDALYMGVPVVSLYGERRNTRFGYSILNSIGISELAVFSVEEYIETVIALASDVKFLDTLHRQLRSRLLNSKSASPRFYMEALEKAYKRILSR